MGGGIVIEQQNLTPHVLSAEVDRLMQDAGLRERMHGAAEKFARPEAARKIAEILLETSLAHEAV
jgi:UDP-N-acetylglucosamine:LPS N-acetylglucosamine transferase